MIDKDLGNKINNELVIPKIDYEIQSKELTKWIQKLIEEGKLIYFYQSAKWKAVRRKVLEAYNNECVLCKMNGKITTTTNNGKSLQVHHMREIELYPMYGLQPIIIDILTGKEVANLIPLCNMHHNLIHQRDKKNFNNINKDKFINEERW